MWLLYECLLLIGLVCYVPKALWRRRLPHRGWSMRLGRLPASVTQPLQGRRALWVHAVSVGEVLAAQPLIQALRRRFPDDPIVLSTITQGGFEVASTHRPSDGAVCYFPLDVRACVARTLEAIHPHILLLVESELWPTVIRMCRARGIPVAVVNGRISSRAFRRYYLIRPWLSTVLAQVDLFLMQSQVDADRILELGARPERVRVVGSLKWDASLGSRPTPELINETVARLGVVQPEPVIVAGSTHRGEEAALLKAFQALRASGQVVRLIVAPRHLERLDEIERLFAAAGLDAVRLSRVNGRTRWDVGLVDTFGQLPRYYGLASLVFIGGSLIPHGGQNPLEATGAGKPVVFGPHMQNFEVITHQLLAHHAARQVGTDRELAELFQELLSHPSQAQAMGHRARELTERFQGATQRTVDALAPLLHQPTWPTGYG